MELVTAHVGAWPVPAALRRARARHAEGAIDDVALGAATDRAQRSAIEAQVDAGVDEITDGHADRADLVAGFAGALEGVASGPLVRVFGPWYARRPRIEGPVRRNGPVGVERWRRAATIADRPVRATLPSPYTLTLGCLDEHRGDRAAVLDEMTAAVAGEVADLVASGADTVQIDEIALGADPADLARAADALAAVSAAAGSGASVWVRFAYGRLADVADVLFGLPVAGLAVTWGALDDDGLDRLSGLDPAVRLGIGVVAGDDPEVETVETIRDRVDRVARATGRDRLWIHPDAGFLGIGSARAGEKLRRLATVAGAAD